MVRSRRAWAGLAAAAAVAVGGSAVAQTPGRPAPVVPADPIPSVLPGNAPALPAVAPKFNLATLPARPTSMTPAPAAGSAPPPVAVGEVLDLTPKEIPGDHGHGEGHGHGGEHGKKKIAHEIVYHPSDPHGLLFATGEYLLWRPRMDGLGFALVDPVNNLVPAGRVANLNHDVASGLRVGLGYKLPGHGWDVGVQFTYLQSTNDQTVSAPPGGVLYPTYTRPGVIDTATKANGFASFDYRVFDIDAGKTWCVDPHLTLRAFAGVRIADINLDYGALYDGGQASQARVENMTGFSGAGPTAGAEATWNVGGGFGLLGRARGGLLYGDFTSRTVETNGAGQVVLADVADEFAGVAPFLSIALGAGYQWKNISLAAGYEVTHYFGLSSRPALIDDFAEGKTLRQRNDFSFDGVFFRVGLAY